MSIALVDGWTLLYRLADEGWTVEDMAWCKDIGAALKWCRTTLGPMYVVTGNDGGIWHGTLVKDYTDEPKCYFAFKNVQDITILKLKFIGQ